MVKVQFTSVVQTLHVLKHILCRRRKRGLLSSIDPTTTALTQQQSIMSFSVSSSFGFQVVPVELIICILSFLSLPDILSCHLQSSLLICILSRWNAPLVLIQVAHTTRDHKKIGVSPEAYTAPSSNNVKKGKKKERKRQRQRMGGGEPEKQQPNQKESTDASE